MRKVFFFRISIITIKVGKIINMKFYPYNELAVNRMKGNPFNVFGFFFVSAACFN